MTKIDPFEQLVHLMQQKRFISEKKKGKDKKSKMKKETDPVRVRYPLLKEDHFHLY